MDYWTDDEWVLSLGYYFFNKDSAVKKFNLQFFTQKLNQLTGKARTIDSIELRVCNWRSLDPDFDGKGLSNDGKKLKEYWQKYIVDDASHLLLAKKFSDFMNESTLTSMHTPIPVCHVSSIVVYYRSQKVKNKLCTELTVYVNYVVHKLHFLISMGNHI